jgi:SAM-dependent methyltransferase
MNRSTVREEAPFCEDVAEHGGYVYTTNGALSGRIANKRQSDAIFEIVDLHRKRVIDIGCGDGTYTFEIYDRAQPSVLCGIDPAAPAIEVANKRLSDRDIKFTCDSAYSIPYPDGSFDVAHLRGVLHHMDRPVNALREAFRVASTIVVLEPNGFNPVLKLIEKMSKYHREHGEKSYLPLSLDRWVGELGGRVTRRDWIGLVPYFCPSLVARTLKIFEPVVEPTPLLRSLGCGNYVFVATRP